MSRRYRKPQIVNTPLFDALLAAGTVKVDFNAHSYYGIAADGTEVWLGSIGDEAGIERYLTTHPTPDTW